MLDGDLKDIVLLLSGLQPLSFFMEVFGPSKDFYVYMLLF